MIAAIHQLHYLPWLRYFDKIARSDVFVVLDDIQYTKNGWQNRNKIKGPAGWIYLTVPVHQKLAQRLFEIEIDNGTPWARKHWQTLTQNYRKSPYFERYAEELEGIYNSSWTHLNALNWEMLRFYFRALGISTPIVRSSELDCEGVANERLVNICRRVNADTYLTGEYAVQVYLDPEYFRAQGIAVAFQKWTAPYYRQLYPKPGFVPDLAILDLLFNHGPESLDIILGKLTIPAPAAGPEASS